MYPNSDIYKAKKIIRNFEEILGNIFLPLFEVTLDPNSHPNLHKFLQQVRDMCANKAIVFE